jgi:large subunit ribosomal protein L25
MASATQTMVEAKPREAADKNAARRLRTTGLIPAVIYGAGKEPRSIAVDPKQITKILASESGHNTIFDVQLDGEQAKAMVVDWQRDPIKGKLLHVDLKRIAMDKKMRLQVPLTLKGEAPGVKTEGGLLDFVMREVEIECLPTDIPSHIDIDVSEVRFANPVIRVADLPKSDKIKYLSDADLTVVHLTSVKEEAAPTADAAAAEAAAGPAEPEVIKKGKQETEGAAEESKEKKK